MASVTVSSPSDFASPVRASIATLGLSALRLLGMIATYENPLLWSFWIGRKNEKADMEGERSLEVLFVRLIHFGQIAQALSMLLERRVDKSLKGRV